MDDIRKKLDEKVVPADEHDKLELQKLIWLIDTFHMRKFEENSITYEDLYGIKKLAGDAVKIADAFLKKNGIPL